MCPFSSSSCLSLSLSLKVWKSIIKLSLSRSMIRKRLDNNNNFSFYMIIRMTRSKEEDEENGVYKISWMSRVGHLASVHMTAQVLPHGDDWVRCCLFIWKSSFA
jgi:hypothetical protein